MFATPPVEVKPAAWSIVSMVAARDVPMYLVTMKAFYRRIGGGNLIAIIARELRHAQRELLRSHFPGITFEMLDEIRTEPCQRGGTWERLLYILDRSQHEYVIQVDPDTLPVGEDLQEVRNCIKTGAAFTMADGHRIEPMAAAAAEARATPGDYIGLVAERQFGNYPGSEHLLYVRGSSGFAGFSRSGFNRAQLEVFHAEMERLVGPQRWREWGSEQCASNFAVANSPGAIVLPYPAYASFHPRGPRNEPKFFHFIGSYRFDEGFFASKCRREISHLARPAVAIS